MRFSNAGDVVEASIFSFRQIYMHLEILLINCVKLLCSLVTWFLLLRVVLLHTVIM